MLRPTFMSFETAKRAISASQFGLDTVGHNISNVSTPGYTRQRVDQVSVTAGGMSSKFRTTNATFSGQGVKTVGISQIRDPYLDTLYRQEACTYGALATKINGLTSVESIIDEINKNGLAAQLEDFIAQLTTYSLDTSDDTIAGVVRNSAINLVKYLNTTANQLSNALTVQKEYLESAVTTDLNVILEEIAYLNEKIREDHIYGNPSNELMDQRNLLIDQLSEYANIKVNNTPEKLADGRTISNLSIVMVDNTTSPPGSVTLVDRGDFNTFSVTEDKNGNVVMNLVEGRDGGVLREDITSNFTSGIVRGYIDVINGKGDYAGNGENGFRGVQYYMMALDTFASTFATVMNTLNSITAAEAAGKNTVFEHLNKNLFTANGGGAITAGNIKVSDRWMGEETFLTISKEDAEDYEPVLDEFDNPMTDPETGQIIYKTDINNDNLNKMIDVLKGSNNFIIYTTDGTRKNLFSGSFGDYLVDMQTDLGADKKVLNTMLEASEAVITNYADMRDSISAVNVDEEAINMMVYQNYYNAAARYMTTLDEALNTIINGMGIVGR